MHTSLKAVPGSCEQKFLSNTSLEEKYQDVLLHGLSAHTSASVQSNKNLLECGIHKQDVWIMSEVLKCAL